MRVHVSDTHLLDDLLHYLRECGCVVEGASGDEADVFLPGTPDVRSARVELDVYITAWRVRNGGVAAGIVYEPSRRRRATGFLGLKA